MDIAAKNHQDVQGACALPETENSFLDRLPGKKTFNVPAIRARVGVVNLLVGVALVYHLAFPGTDVVLYVSGFLLFDMLMAVAFGLISLSLTGCIGTLLTWKMPFVPTPHLPKRFAWSMGASLALTIVVLSLMQVGSIWISLALVTFFTLSWLDAVLGFCMGCWLYSKLFDCQSCRLA